MKTVKEFLQIECWDIKDKLQMYHDYQEYEKSGTIGQCKLREVAENYINQASYEGLEYNTVIIIQHIMFELYREFSEYYVSSCNEC